MKNLKYKLFAILIMVAAVSINVYAQLRKGPYLIYPNKINQMHVLYQTHNTQQCTIYYGTNPNNLNKSVITEENSSLENEHMHSYILKGLLPGTKYYYKITGNNINTEIYSFKCAPGCMTDQIIFYAYGDTRSNPSAHNQVCGEVLDEIESYPTSQTFIMHAGDWVNRGNCETDWDQQYFNQSYYYSEKMKALLPVMGVRGNHELNYCEQGSQTDHLFRKYWPYDETKYYYTYCYGPVQIFALDQYEEWSANSPQLMWFENELQNCDKPWKVVTFHEPGFTPASQVNQLVVNAIQPLCEEYGVQLVIAGHKHYYAHCENNQVHHLTLGGGGAPLYDPISTHDCFGEKTYHYAKITINKENMEYLV